MFILLLFWFTVLACTAKIIKKFKLAYLNFNNNCIIIRESPTQNRKIWCKHIFNCKVKKWCGFLCLLVLSTVICTHRNWLTKNKLLDPPLYTAIWKPTNVAMFILKEKLIYCSNDSIKFWYPNVDNVELRTMLNRAAFFQKKLMSHPL